MRAACAADAEAIVAIYAPHVLNGTASFETQAPDADAMRTRMTGSNGFYPWIVAVDGSKENKSVLAYAYASWAIGNARLAEAAVPTVEPAPFSAVGVVQV